MCYERIKLGSFGGLWRILEFGSEDDVPHPAGDTEAVLVISKVVLKVVFLELLVVRRKA
jgi:hypothetical protein